MLKPRLSVETSAFSPEVLPTLSAVGLECLAQRLLIGMSRLLL